MMTYRGRVTNGQIILDGPAALPEGAAVEVAVTTPDEGATTAEGSELSALLLRHAGRGRDLPADLAERHDHYVHGLPRT